MEKREELPVEVELIDISVALTDDKPTDNNTLTFVEKEQIELIVAPRLQGKNY